MKRILLALAITASLFLTLFGLVALSVIHDNLTIPQKLVVANVVTAGVVIFVFFGVWWAIGPSKK